MTVSILGLVISVAALWLCVTIVLGVVEALTQELIAACFSGGALIGAIVAKQTDLIWVQVAAFAAVTFILLLIRPFVKKKLGDRY